MEVEVDENDDVGAVADGDDNGDGGGINGVDDGGKGDMSILLFFLSHEKEEEEDDDWADGGGLEEEDKESCGGGGDPGAGMGTTIGRRQGPVTIGFLPFAYTFLDRNVLLFFEGGENLASE